MFSFLVCGLLLSISLVSSATVPLCGYSNVEGLDSSSNVTDQAKYGEFPWMVEILIETYSFQLIEKTHKMLGGGVLLNPRIVLTTAHLVKEYRARDLLARAGEWDRSQNTERFPHQDRRVSRSFIHNDFSPYGKSPYTNNIALLWLQSAFNLEEANIRPICIPPAEEYLDYSSCYASGWGKRYMQSQTTEMILKKIHLPIVPFNQCLRQWNTFISTSLTLDESLLCAGGEQGVDTCEGDGGSPLVCLLKNSVNRYALVGLVVAGRNCGMKDLPGLYANIPHFLPWIHAKLLTLFNGTHS